MGGRVSKKSKRTNLPSATKPMLFGLMSRWSYDDGSRSHDLWVSRAKRQEQEPQGEKPEPQGEKPEHQGEKPEHQGEKPEPKGEKPEPKGEKPEVMRSRAGSAHDAVAREGVVVAVLEGGSQLGAIAEGAGEWPRLYVPLTHPERHVVAGSGEVLGEHRGEDLQHVYVQYMMSPWNECE